MHRGEQVFAAGREVPDRAADDARQRQEEDRLAVESHLAAEGAADVRGDDPDVLLRHAKRLRRIGALQPGRLRAQPERVLVSFRIVGADAAPSLHRQRRDPAMADMNGKAMIGGRELSLDVSRLDFASRVMLLPNSS